MWLCVPWPLGLEGSLSLCRPLFLSLATAGWTRGPVMAFCGLAQKPMPIAACELEDGDWAIRWPWLVPHRGTTWSQEPLVNQNWEVGVQAVGKRRQVVSRGRRERRMGGWGWLERERHQFLSSFVRPLGRSCSNLLLTGVHFQGPLLLPTEKLAHIPWTEPWAPQSRPSSHSAFIPWSTHHRSRSESAHVGASATGLPQKYSMFAL